MKKLLIICFLISSISVMAQRIDKPNEPYYVYSYLTIGMQNDAQLTIGEDGNNYIIADEDGKKLSFPSKVFFLHIWAKGDGNMLNV